MGAVKVRASTEKTLSFEKILWTNFATRERDQPAP